MTMPRLLGGRYEIGETLGHGGMAEVHLGRDTRLGRDVAIKVLRHDLARDTSFQARFRREAQNAAALNHPSIVAVYDTGDEPASDGVGLPYIVMEYVEGRTLREVLEAEGKLMPTRAMEITADVCAALEFSHRNGIVHRDIKPANVMLSPNGQVKVMDFGIARAVAQGSATMTQTSAVIGTAQYLSPEQARGETVDNRSDIYSTGCLLYELLVGQPPFTGDSPVSVAYQHVREDPTPPSERDPDIPAVADSVVLKAMAKNPANRYQSAAEMRADLVRAAAGRPVEATPVLTGADRTQVVAATPAAAATSTMLRRPPEPDRRRRGLAYAALALAVVGVFVLAAFLTQSFTSGSGKVLVPKVTGLSQADAVSALEAKNLKAKIKTDFSSEADKGKVTKQSVPEGTPVQPDTTVTLTVGQGTEKVTVPSLAGLTRDEAQNKLGSLGLIGDIKTVPSDLPENDVVSVPLEGTAVPINSKIVVNVSDGSVKVPNVVDLSEDAAKNALRDFRVSVIEEISARPEGTVIRSNPPAGALLKKGSSITITVAKKAPEPTPTPSPSPSPTPIIIP